MIPTPKAFELIRLVPKTLKQPELTAKWELELSKISQGKADKKNFIKNIRIHTIDLVNQIKSSELRFTISNLSSEKCPLCGKPMMKFSQNFVCSDRRCGYEQNTRKQSGLNTKRKSQKEKRMDKQLMKRYGKQKQQSETLGDLFDL